MGINHNPFKIGDLVYHTNGILYEVVDISFGFSGIYQTIKVKVIDDSCFGTVLEGDCFPNLPVRPQGYNMLELVDLEKSYFWYHNFRKQTDIEKIVMDMEKTIIGS